MTLTYPEALVGHESPEDVRLPLSEAEYAALRDRFHEPEDNYNILRGDKQAINNRLRVWDTDYVLERYAAETDQLIGVLDGSIEDGRAIGVYGEDRERGLGRPDTVVWLDKSARPVSWLVDAFWDQYAKPGVGKPEYEFLNVDRVNWFTRQGYTAEEAEGILNRMDFSLDKVPPKDIAAIRALFVDGEISDTNWETEVWQRPTRLDNQKLLVVDEVMNRGGTLSIAMQLLQKAVPEAVVSGTYFWHPARYALNGDTNQLQGTSVPVWYNRNDSFGRGIGEISELYWRHEYEQNPGSETLKRKLGWFVLSAPHFDSKTFELLSDEKAELLQHDIRQLAEAVADGRVFRRTIRQRSEEDNEAIRRSQGLTLREQAQYMMRRNAENPELAS